MSNLGEALNGGFEAIIAGPGTSAEGVRYWFETEREAYSFVENLNLSYREARGLARWRKSHRRKQNLKHTSRSLQAIAAG